VDLAWRREYASPLILAAQAVLLAAAWQIAHPGFRVAALTMASGVGLWAWLAALARHRAIADTPTSRIASAAQGYVELVGQGRALPGAPLFSPMSGLPCLWYRYTLQERVNNRWEQARGGESEQAFLLDDGSGHCLVDPGGAEVHVSRGETRQVGDRRYTEWLLLAGAPLYVLGQFTSSSASHQDLDERQDLDDLLHDWKGDPGELKRRFDRDGDGRIDPEEWNDALAAARQQVREGHRQRLREPIRHRLGKPRRAPYLISDHAPDTLGRRHARWAAAHLGTLLALVGAWSWLARELW